MARFALSLILSFTISCQAFASENDATVLVQRLVSGPNHERGGYAPDKFAVGEEVEGKGKGDRWLAAIVTAVKPAGTFDIHVIDEYPGYDLPNVPANLLRRPLTRGMSDWLVDNSRLQHQGHGVLYRYSKDSLNKSAEYAPWGSLVVGHDEGDGWVKVAGGYLPVEVHGSVVLREMERGGEVSPMAPQFRRAKRAAEEERKKKEEEQATATPTPPPVTYQAGENAEFQTRQGVWYPVRVVDVLPKNTYNIVLQKDSASFFPVKGAHGSRMRKGDMPPHEPQPDESPMCQRDGCITVVAKTEDGSELKLHVSKRMKVDMLMKMACNKAGVEESACQEVTFSHDGVNLVSTEHIRETRLNDGDVVQMKLKPTN